MSSCLVPRLTTTTNRRLMISPPSDVDYSGPNSETHVRKNRDVFFILAWQTDTWVCHRSVDQSKAALKPSRWLFRRVMTCGRHAGFDLDSGPLGFGSPIFGHIIRIGTGLWKTIGSGTMGDSKWCTNPIIIIRWMKRGEYIFRRLIHMKLNSVDINNGLSTRF